MLFKPGTPVYSYEVQREAGGQAVYVNYLGASFVPNIADNPEVMNRTIDLLIDSPDASRIVFVQQRNYSYNPNQVFMLQEIANLYVFLTKQEKILSPIKLSISNSEYLGHRYNDVAYLLITLKRDPLSCYFELERFLGEEKSNLGSMPQELKFDKLNYIRLLERFYSLLGNTRIILESEKYFGEYRFGSRDIYFHFFRPDIIPNFTFTRLAASLPEDAEIVHQYEIGDEEDISIVTILKREEDTKYFYHLMPPEYSLDENKQNLLNLARNVLIEHQPKAEEFTDPEKTRQVFFNVSRDLLSELSESRGIKLGYNELNKLAKILVRHTIGFGLIEVLLYDTHLQDIVLNAPIPANPVYLRHQDYDECSTNIIPSREDADSWAAKFRMTSGRPLDEANPILDTDLSLGRIRARISVIQQPLSPNGLAYAIRRHREEPWTLSLFIKNKMLNSFSAGLLSFLIDGSRTMLIAGTRSSGKCVDGDTLIQLGDGDIRKIKDLIGTKKREISDGAVYTPYSEICSPSLNGMKINNKKITDVWKRDSPKKVVKIKTRSGKEIITTQEHPYFIYDNKLKNIRADMLKKGDLIVSPRELEVFGKEMIINLNDNSDLISESKDFFFLKGKTNSQIVRFPKKITPEFAEFIGMIIGDGHLDKTKLEFHNSCKELRERYISLFKIFNVKYRVFKSRTTFVVQITSRTLNRILNETFEIPFGKKSDKVVIPQFILKSNNNILASFLRGYFDCDGYIPLNKRDIELVTASKIMSEHLRLALLRFGITVFTKPKKIKGIYYYRNHIRGNFVNNFAKNIGFFHPFKKERLYLLLSRNFLDNSNVDTIPQGNEILKNLRRNLRVSPKELRVSGKDYWAYENNKYRVTRNWFKKLVKFYRQRYDFLDSKKEQIDILKNFINFDYKNYLSKLEKIRKLLGLSYTALAIEIGISERGVRKILKNGQAGSFEMFKKISFLIEKINKKFEEISSLRNIEININSIPIFVDKGVVSYAELSRECNVPESSLKYYCQNNNPVISQEKEFLIESKLREIKNKSLCWLNEASFLLNELCSNNLILNSINFGMILSNFRNILNIPNEEFASRGISITSVTNFFNGHYKPNFETLRVIVKTIIELFNSSSSEEVYNLILEAGKLADSDIFWDEIVSVDLIDKVDDYVYDLTVENTHNFVANGLIAHNTSLLGSLMLEIMSKYRIICLEDTRELPIESLRKLKYDILGMKVRSALLKTSNEIGADEGIRTSLRLGDSCLIVGEVRSSIRGNEEVVIIDNGFMRRIQIKDLENKDLRNVYVPTIGFDLKVKLSKLTNFVKHPKRKKLLRIKTKTGREVTVTPDHSLFSPTKDFEIAPIECKNLKAGNQIVIPSYMSCDFNNINFINIFDYLPEFRVENFENYIREAIKILGWKKATEICNINTGDIYNYFRRNQKTNIPLESFKNLMKKAKIDYDINNLNIKKGTSLSIPAKIPINEDFCRFLGYYVSEGYYSLKEKDGGNVVITNSNPEIMEDISNISKSLFKLPPKRRIVKSLGSSIQHQLHCFPLAKLISKLGCGRTCYEKRVPLIIFGLSKEKIAAFLKGLYSGDGCFTSSESSGNCVRYFSTSKKLVEDVSYLLLNFSIVARIIEKKPSGRGKNNLWILEFKDREMVETFLSEIGFVRRIPEMMIRKWAHTTSNFVKFDKEILKKHLTKYPRRYRHLFRFLRCSKNYLKKVVLDSECEVSEKLKTFALGNFFLDEIKEIEEIELDEEEYVYDLSVAPTENFIGGFGGILLHNTEAQALYEAMRVGALANVVAGTIHGASPYGVFDRVVNDLKVPITSFKATDCIVIANPVKTSDGMKSMKRVVQLTEVRKHWTIDPETEGGFVDLLKYNVEKDDLEASEELINGDSEIIKSVASGVRGWAGNWDAVYDNIELRGKIKQELVDISEKIKIPEILEAKFNSLSNNMFHQFSEKVREEIGLPESSRVFPMWQEWLKKEVKKFKI